MNCPRRAPSSSLSSFKPYGGAGRQKGRTRGDQRGRPEAMRAPRAEDGDRDTSVLGPHSCSSRPKQTNGDRGQWGRMGGKTESYTYSIPSLPVSPKTFPKPGTPPLHPGTPLLHPQYCFFLLFRITPTPQRTLQPDTSLARPPLLHPPPWHPPTVSPCSPPWVQVRALT